MMTLFLCTMGPILGLWTWAIVRHIRGTHVGKAESCESCSCHGPGPTPMSTPGDPYDYVIMTIKDDNDS